MHVVKHANWDGKGVQVNLLREKRKLVLIPANILKLAANSTKGKSIGFSTNI